MVHRGTLSEIVLSTLSKHDVKAARGIRSTTLPNLALRLVTSRPSHIRNLFLKWTSRQCHVCLRDRDVKSFPRQHSRHAWVKALNALCVLSFIVLRHLTASHSVNWRRLVCMEVYIINKKKSNMPDLSLIASSSCFLYYYAERLVVSHRNMYQAMARIWFLLLDGHGPWQT